ncbi:hypothetical protein P3S67_032582 [Capsicum chacoense]
MLTHYAFPVRNRVHEQFVKFAPGMPPVNLLFCSRMSQQSVSGDKLLETMMLMKKLEMTLMIWKISLLQK